MKESFFDFNLKKNNKCFSKTKNVPKMAVYYYFLCVYTWFIITQEFFTNRLKSKC